ncbi:tyrosine-type recombinase/integrase [Nocardia sp. NPDC101769]|uniref:tyrosine-type recombinase/integrase n=1 Tax=Nocardia sp. NPDC101769 TaxID=3364333 RepID=UPI0038049CD8
MPHTGLIYPAECTAQLVRLCAGSSRWNGQIAAIEHFDPGRFSAVSRIHTKSDLRLYFYWCIDHQLTPLAVARTEVERYMRWMQEVRRFKPATVARRLAVVAGFYRTCVIDGVLDRSPAEYVRRPRVSNESPTLGLSHLQFAALLCAARDSDNPPDFALVAMLGLLGLRISEACRCDISDLGEEQGKSEFGVSASFGIAPNEYYPSQQATGTITRGQVVGDLLGGTRTTSVNTVLYAECGDIRYPDSGVHTLLIPNGGR